MGGLEKIIGTAALIGALYVGGLLVSKVSEHKNPHQQATTQPTRAPVYRHYEPKLRYDGEKMFLQLPGNSRAYFEDEEAGVKFMHLYFNLQNKYQARLSKENLRQLVDQIDDKMRTDRILLDNAEIARAEYNFEQNGKEAFPLTIKPDPEYAKWLHDKILKEQDDYFAASRKRIRQLQEEYAREKANYRPDYKDVPSEWHK